MIFSHTKSLYETQMQKQAILPGVANKANFRDGKQIKDGYRYWVHKMVTFSKLGS